MEDDTPLFTPQDSLRYIAAMRNVEEETFRIPPRLIIVYQRRHFDLINEIIHGKPVQWWWYADRLQMSVGRSDQVEIAAVTSFVGSPAAAMVIEELVACGAKKIIEVGTSGGIQPFLKPGDIIVADEAMSDEGTTRHYFPNVRKLSASSLMKRQLVKALNEHHINHEVGTVLSTDGVYRETMRKIGKFRSLGVLAVNMETSALYAIAEYRGVELVSAQIISDLLTEAGWQPAFHEERVSSNIKKLLKLAVEAVSKA